MDEQVVHCINLESAKERKENITKQFNLHGVKVSFFNAVKPEPDKFDYGISKRVLDNIITKTRKTKEDIGSWGGIGCYWSHTTLWHYLLSYSYRDYFIIIEDDIHFKGYKTGYNNDQFFAMIEKELKELPEDWDFYLLGVQSKRGNYVPKDKYDRILGPFFGLHAYVVSRRGAENAFKKVFPIEYHIDSQLGILARTGDLNVYSRKQSLFKQSWASIILNSSINTPCQEISNDIAFYGMTGLNLGLLSLLVVKTIASFNK